MERCGDCEKACDALGEGAEGGFADDTESSESDSSESVSCRSKDSPPFPAAKLCLPACASVCWK